MSSLCKWNKPSLVCKIENQSSSSAWKVQNLQRWKHWRMIEISFSCEWKPLCNIKKIVLFLLGLGEPAETGFIMKTQRKKEMCSGIKIKFVAPVMLLTCLGYFIRAEFRSVTHGTAGLWIGLNSPWCPIRHDALAAAVCDRIPSAVGLSEFVPEKQVSLVLLNFPWERRRLIDLHSTRLVWLSSSVEPQRASGVKQHLSTVPPAQTVGFPWVPLFLSRTTEQNKASWE